MNYKNNKKISEYDKKQKEKNDKILVFRKSKLNSIETLVSQALINVEISHEEFITILKKFLYEKMKEDIRTMKGGNELNNEKSRKTKLQNYK